MNEFDALKLSTGAGRDPQDEHFDFADWWSHNPEKIDVLAKKLGQSRSSVLGWRTSRVPIDHVEFVSKFTGVSVEILRHGRVRSIDTGIYGGINIPIYGHRAKDLELLRARSRNLPASLDNELMGTPPNGRSAWDQTKAIRGDDGRLLADELSGDLVPLNTRALFDRIRNITLTHTHTQET